MSSQPNSSILEVLPIDVLDLILQEVRRTSFPTLCNIRFVSKGFNALVEPLAFGAVALLPYNPLSSEFQAQLKRLASGKSPNSRWTKKLRIGTASLIPVVKLQDGHSWASQDGSDTELRRQSALVIQKKYLVRAIEALKHVTYASYPPQDKEPYGDVLGALSRLPNLEHLSLSFCSKFGSQPLPLEAFSNLRVIELVQPRLFPSVISSIRGMLIASSMTLESFTITPYEWGREFGGEEPPGVSRMARVLELDALLRESLPNAVDSTSEKETAFERLSSHIGNVAQTSSRQEGPTQYPRLKKLTINANRIGLSAAVVSRLPSLTHLDAVNVGAGHIEEGFWNALRQEKIRLDSLMIWSLSSPVTEYLTTYSGLKTLFLRDLGEVVSAMETNRLFTVVLSRHSRTLENLWLDGSVRRGYSTATEEGMEGIARCRELQNLWISYPFPASTEGDGGEAESYDQRSKDMGVFFSRLAVSLPKLRNLLIRPSRQMPRFACKTGRTKFLSKLVNEFIENISEADVEGATPSYTISVRGAAGGGIMEFDQEKGRFKQV